MDYFAKVSVAMQKPRKVSGRSTCNECEKSAEYHILEPVQKNALCPEHALQHEANGIPVCQRKMWSKENELLRDSISDPVEREERVRQVCLRVVMERPYAQRRRIARSHSECQAKALAEQPQRPRQRQRTWQEHTSGSLTTELSGSPTHTSQDPAWKILNANVTQMASQLEQQRHQIEKLWQQIKKQQEQIVQLQIERQDRIQAQLEQPDVPSVCI